MKEYLTEWLSLVKPSIRQKTYDSYEGITRVHLIPRFGHIKLNRLTTEHVNKVWAEMLEAGHSPALIWHCHVRLNNALNYAQTRRYIIANPLQFVTKPKVEVKERLTLTVEEMDRVLALAKDIEKYRDYHSIILTAFHTGMRRNELLGLRWKDIDEDMAILYLSRSIYRAKGGVTETHPTKTKSGARSVDMPPDLAIHLREQRAVQEKNAKYFRYTVTEESPVFIRRTGEPLLPAAVTHVFKRIARKLGFDAMTFHSLRHTHATHMLQKDIQPKVVMERLGHKNISTTLDTYQHVTRSMQKDAVLKFQQSLDEARQEVATAKAF